MAIDGNSVVAGAFKTHTHPYNSGSAYVFRTLDSGATYGQVAKLTASDAGFDDNFGRSVAIAGGTIVVGRSNAAADTAPDGQSDGSSGLLLLHRRLQRLHGAVDETGLLERKRSVRNSVRSLVCWFLARTAASDAVARGHAGICRDRRPRL